MVNVTLQLCNFVDFKNIYFWLIFNLIYSYNKEINILIAQNYSQLQAV